MKKCGRKGELRMESAVTLMFALVWVAGLIALLLVMGFCAEVLPKIIRQAGRRAARCRGYALQDRRCCR